MMNAFILYVISDGCILVVSDPGILYFLILLPMCPTKVL